MPAAPDRAARGQAVLADRARRVRLLRARIVVTVAAAFALLWGLIAATGDMTGGGDAGARGAHRDVRGPSGVAGDVLTTRQS